MRTFIFPGAVFLVSLLPAVAAAQDTAASSLRGGFTVAMTSSTLAGSGYPGAERRTSFNPGLIIEQPVSAFANVRTGIVLASRGARRDIVGGHEEVILEYLEVPLLFSFHPTTHARAIRPYVVAGAHVGFALGCGMADASGGQYGRWECVNSVPAPRLAKHDVALLGGGGLRHAFDKLVLGYEVLYAHGLRRYEASSDSRNRGFSLGAVLTFPLTFR